MLGPPPELATGEREIAILVDAETGVAGKINPGAMVDIVATFAGNDQTGRKAESEIVVPGARIIDVGQPELKGGNGAARAGGRPAAGRAGHLRAEPEAGADRDLRRVVRRGGPPVAAAAGRGVQAQEEAARLHDGRGR